MQSAVRVWRKQKKDKERLGKKGVILSWTEVFVSPLRFETMTPYTIVLVELEDQNRVYGQLVDFEKDQRTIGREVVSVFRKMGAVGSEDVVEYGVKFKPHE